MQKEKTYSETKQMKESRDDVIKKNRSKFRMSFPWLEHY